MDPELHIVLTPKQQRFVEEYLVDLNATQAAVRAGYAPASAHVTSSRILAKRQVRAHVEGVIAKRFGVTKLSIIEELAAIAFHDIGDYVSWTNDNIRVTPSAELSPWHRKAIASVRQIGPEAGPIELKLCDKLRALELLARVLGLFDSSAASPPHGRVHFIIETPEA
jgi:phage terminase small subunit